MTLLLYVLVLVALALNAPADVWDPGSRAFIVIIGGIGLWRYAWGAVHFVRSIIYRKLVFPGWRRRADRLVAAEAAGVPGARARVPEVFCIVTSYRIRAETTVAVYRALIDNLIDYGQPAVIVASVVEAADLRLVKQLFRKMNPPPTLRLAVVRLAGAGKRHALATSLRAVSRMGPLPESAVVVMDGDTVLAPHTIARTLPFLRLMRRVGGLTTDEDCVVEGRRTIRTWHRLRFAQRHLLMSSLGLSRRLLAMTGRMSAFRAEIATNPSFIDMVANDALDHWRLGRLPLLTGEDKSTWLWLLERDWDMIYVPDVRVLTIEHPPSRSFFRASTQLMLRWFGNMLRASGRAISLGPARTGPFIWWCLIDQRVSMWTPLVGPVATLMSAATHSLSILYIYLMWVMSTRLIQALSLLSVRDTISGLWPPLIYYNQVYGALVKTWVLFRLDRQRWTRQNIALRQPMGAGQARLRAWGSAYLHGLALVTLCGVLAFLAGILTFPPLASLTRLF
ncbi:MAG: glycosyltransferase [Geminicoccaceae bacterium]